MHRWCELAARTYNTAGASLQLVPTIKELVALSKKHYE